MRSRITHQIAVLANHLGNPFEASLISMVESQLAGHGYQMLLHTYQHGSGQWLADAMDRIDGLLLLGQTLDDSITGRYREAGIPTVSLLHPTWEKADIPHVDLNWLKVMRRTIEYLQSLGHEQIGFMANGDPAHYHTHRYSAFIQAMQICQLKLDHASVLHGGGTYLKAYDAMEKKLLAGELSCTVLICANDLMAIGVLAACRNHGLRIPEQLAVIGCEDILMSSETNPPLTTIQFAREEMSRSAVALLLARLRGEEIEVTEPEGYLVIRGST